jgi:hypothetical protein
MTAQTSLSRLAFGIGQASDATGTWVPLDVQIEISIQAARHSADY